MRRTLIAAALLAGIGLRDWAMLMPQGALDSDEAVVGLITHGILHGTIPAFFPGQGYGGTQEELLAVPLVAAAGLETWAIRVPVLVLWLAAAVLVWRYFRYGGGWSMLWCSTSGRPAGRSMWSTPAPWATRGGWPRPATPAATA